MKRRISFILCGMLVLFSAVSFAADIECVQKDVIGADTPYNVMKAVLDNGQTLYYLSMEDGGEHLMEDVNFDGHRDFVPVTVMGARNFFSLFYLYNPQNGQYEPVVGGEQGFCNYELYPDSQLLVSSVSDGYRDGETKIYRWAGYDLVLLRSAEVGNLNRMEFDEKRLQERWDFTQYEMTVVDYTEGEGQGKIIYQEVYPEDDPQVEAHLEALQEALWKGL